MCYFFDKLKKITLIHLLISFQYIFIITILYNYNIVCIIFYIE